MKKNLKIFKLLIVFFWAFWNSNVLGQTEGLLKTTEYSGKEKRRDMFLDKDMNVVQESYYSYNSEQIVNTIFYDNNGKLLRLIGYENYPKITFDVDFSKGTYEIPGNKIKLKFKNRFVFDGLQKGDNIVVNYSNGVRQGRLIQTDSAEYGTKTVVYQRPKVGLLSRFNILQFYNEIGEEDTYKVYKGLILNFSNNQLNGRQLGYFVNGASKIKANFSNGKVLNYSSFNQEGSTLSNIIADSNAIVKKPYILNGIIEREKLNLSFKNTQLQNTGKISFRDDFEKNNGYYMYFFEERYEIDENQSAYTLDILREASDDDYTIDNYYNVNSSESIDLKKLFDDKKITVQMNNPHVLRMVFKIPLYNVERFDFEKNDQTDLEIIENEINQKANLKYTENNEIEIAENKTNQKVPLKENSNKLTEYIKFYDSIIQAIKSIDSNFELVENRKINNWIDAKIKIDDNNDILNTSFENMLNKNSNENLIYDAILEFSKITILAGLKMSNENSQIKKQELEEYIFNNMINLGHGFLILSYNHENKKLFENAMNIYSYIPMDKKLVYYGELTGEKIILKDWKELIKNKVIDKEYIKDVNLKNLITQK